MYIFLGDRPLLISAAITFTVAGFGLSGVALFAFTDLSWAGWLLWTAVAGAVATPILACVSTAIAFVLDR